MPIYVIYPTILPYRWYRISRVYVYCCATAYRHIIHYVRSKYTTYTHYVPSIVGSGYPIVHIQPHTFILDAARKKMIVCDCRLFSFFGVHTINVIFRRTDTLHKSHNHFFSYYLQRWHMQTRTRSDIPYSYNERFVTYIFEDHSNILQHKKIQVYHTSYKNFRNLIPF